MGGEIMPLSAGPWLGMWGELIQYGKLHVGPLC